MTKISLSSISVSYEDKVILRDVNLAIAAGSRIAVMGPSGSGKSTLLRVIARLHTKHAGNVNVTGKIGYMPQDSRDAVVPWRRVEKLVPDSLDREQLGLAGHSHLLPGKLSGGQLRRVALGHIFQLDKHIYLLDEPLTGLDVDLRGRMIKFIKTQLDPDDILLFVTHYVEEAEILATEAIYVAEGICQHYADVCALRTDRRCATV